MELLSWFVLQQLAKVASRGQEERPGAYPKALRWAVKGLAYLGDQQEPQQIEDKAESAEEKGFPLPFAQGREFVYHGSCDAFHVPKLRERQALVIWVQAEKAILERCYAHGFTPWCHLGTGPPS